MWGNSTLGAANKGEHLVLGQQLVKGLERRLKPVTVAAAPAASSVTSLMCCPCANA